MMGAGDDASQLSNVQAARLTTETVVGCRAGYCVCVCVCVCVWMCE